MALPATVRRFEIQLADTDRGVYETLTLRVAQHPSESEVYLVARVLARCLEHEESVDFSRGLDAPDEPAVWQRDLTGELRAWIEVGSPSPERLHRASKTGARVSIYAWKDPARLAREIAAFGVHRADELALFALPPELLAALAATLDRVNRWEVAISGGTLYVTVGGALHEGAVARVAV